MKPPKIQKQSLDALKVAFPQLSNIYMCINDKQATKSLENESVGNNVLVATYASSRAGGIDEDNIQEKDNIWLFILKSQNPKDYEPNSFLDLMEETFQLTALIKTYIVKNSIFNGKINMTTTPEYESFNSNWHGYAININFDTKGFSDEYTC